MKKLFACILIITCVFATLALTRSVFAVRRVLIYGPSESGYETALWIAYGNPAPVSVNSSTWLNMTAEEFASYSAIVFCDPTGTADSSVFDAANANKDVWSSVITGPIVLLGTDPARHQMQGDSDKLFLNAVEFVASSSGTGLYVALGNCWTNASSPVTISFLNKFGAFIVIGRANPQDPAYALASENITIVAPDDPVMNGITAAGLSNWNNSVHEFFLNYPSSFSPLAVADRPSSGVLPCMIARMQSVGVRLLWKATTLVNEIAVSKDGKYIAMVNDTGIYYYASNSPLARWWYSENSMDENFTSVAISADGDYVVAGNNSQGAIYYFGHCIDRSELQANNSYSWKNAVFGPNIGLPPGTVGISDDGEYVVVGGTGEPLAGRALYYFINCTSRTSPAENWTWSSFNAGPVESIAISPNGRYIAVVGGVPPASYHGLPPFYYPNYQDNYVAFYKDANIQPYPTSHAWEALTVGWFGLHRKVALSDDGYAVAAIISSPPPLKFPADLSTISLLAYWGNASVLSGNPSPTWNKTFGYPIGVCISASGNEVVASTANSQPGWVAGVHFWSNAKVLQGGNVSETWQRYEVESDIKMSEDGEIIAGAGRQTDEHWAYFYTSDNRSLGEYQLSSVGLSVFMSRNGETVVMTNSALWQQQLCDLFVFSVAADLSAPYVGIPSFSPTRGTIQPYASVRVSVNVTDLESGVKNVTLNYSLDNGTTWENSVLMNLDKAGAFYEGTIPGQPGGTAVRFKIVAFDNADNSVTKDGTTPDYNYIVVSEFSAILGLCVFMIITLLSLGLARRRYSRREFLDGKQGH